MPILRLVMIYLVLALVVVGVFNRDRLIALFGDEPAQAVASEPVPETEQAAPVEPAAPATTAEATTPAEPAASGNVPYVLQTPSSPMPAAQPQAHPPAAPSTSAPGDEDLAVAVNAAREVYWSGDLAGAEARLTALAESHPDNADLQGELGNFYFTQRNYPAAATAFLRAGEILVSEGRYAQAAALLPVLGQIDYEKAQLLAQKLQSQ